MTPARLTKAEAKALAKAGVPGLDNVVDHKVKLRRTAKGPYYSKCKKCGAEFHTIAAEDRHLHDTHHARYEIFPGYGGSDAPE